MKVNNEKNILENYLKKFKKELYGNIIPFWMKHSPDKKYGGYFTCLDRFGKVYDNKKYIWLQGRQVWMFSKLYNTVEKKREWFEMAKLGVDFMRKYAKDASGRVYFSLTREGSPFFIQRKIFAECFYIMGLCEYSRAAGDRAVYNEAIGLFWKVYGWSKDGSKLGRPNLSGQGNVHSLSVPMILLNLIEDIADESNLSEFSVLIDGLLKDIMKHVDTKRQLVFENVSDDSNFKSNSEGRLLNPGHAIECGWFLLNCAVKRNDSKLMKEAENIIDWSFDLGWDKKHGGLFYFLDSGRTQPTQLEWAMKLWWPHVETMYAFLLLYSLTGSKKYLDKFIKVTDYTFSNFRDSKYGEWFGYLDREGKRTHDFKGGPYKGCFHIPRSLLFSIQLLENMILKSN